MPLLSVIRFFGILISLVVLGVSAYLLWTWYSGDTLVDEEGDLTRIREYWRLWLGLVLLAWSFLGRFVVPFLLAKGDKRPARFEHGDGQLVEGETGTIYVGEHGQGPVTIVLTHGWSLDSSVWGYTKEDIGSGVRLINWDLPGMGKSVPRDRVVIGLTTFAAELRRLIETRTGPEPVVLVGHSIGGMTIQTLARDHPDLFSRQVDGVVLLNTTYTNPLKTMILSGLMQALRKPILEPAMRLTMLLQPIVWLMAWQSYLSGWTHIANRFGFGKYVTRSQLNHVSLLTTRNSPGDQAKGNLAMFNWDATGALSDLNVPVLVIGGELDIVTKAEASKAIAASSRLARLEIIEGVNHLGFLERPDLYSAAIANFAAEIQRRPPVP
ncbi:alpha/beta hydrolase [Pelagibacterium sp. H642]|uniref:alpha/beta fold hydrolase n=1 Tax=Pelagibacterium sp. H642 TaxID=1881069 RepID=UPI00281588EC|nr:alpha/beta hydrolase [Pelagibacterium sp. H642]WMT92795.1 alpha/beta hydrolase [Pelagibacterium sp. H642]